jgi:formylmethanofuran dehydrogenase subunit E
MQRYEVHSAVGYVACDRCHELLYRQGRTYYSDGVKHLCQVCYDEIKVWCPGCVNR